MATSTRSRVAPGNASRVRIIRSDADIRDGVAHLRRVCPHLRRAHEMVGDPPLRRYPSGFEGLARIVVGQQLSAASAAAIWGRTASAVDPFSPQELARAPPERLRAAGLSAAKIRTLAALAQAVNSRALDLERLRRADEATVRERLTAVHGIGPWTADIYLLFCLRRADAWASGDLALQLATGALIGSGGRLDSRKLESVAERWRPWRGVAARLLWAWYGANGALVRDATRPRS